MMGDRTFHTSLVTPEQTVLEADVAFAVVPACDGLQGILPHHAPLITKMGVGILKLETPTEVHRFMVNGGYMQMKDNALTILTDEAIAESIVTPELIATEQTRAEALPETTPQEAQVRKQALARAIALKKLTEAT
jgi:F-type H+-transporting ATPase subunit epsilon